MSSFDHKNIRQHCYISTTHQHMSYRYVTLSYNLKTSYLPHPNIFNKPLIEPLIKTNIADIINITPKSITANVINTASKNHINFSNIVNIIIL